jgi:hypothetical protein
MSLADTDVKTTHANGAGGTTFAIPFAASQEQSSRVKVYTRDESDPEDPIITLQTEGAGDDYTIDQAGANVVFNATVPAGIKVIIARELPLTQPLDLAAAASLRPETLETQLDDIVKMVQQLNEKLARAPALHITEQIADLELPQPIGDNLIGWNNAGTALRNFTRTEFDLVTGDLASTDDLPEGSTNKYFTNARADARADIRIAALVPANPLTTTGDIIYGVGTVPTRIGIGATGQRLAVAGGIPSWVYGSPVQIQRSVTGTDTCTNADEVLNLSGASFTENLFTAVGNDGKRLTLKHLGTSLTQEYTIDPNGAQTVGGKSTIKMTTFGEVFVIEARGGNWDIVYHHCGTDWSASAAITVASTGTAMAKGTTTVDSIRWRRVGNCAHIKLNYKQTAAGTVGTGDYYYTLPTGLVADSTYVNFDTTVYGATVILSGCNFGSAFLATTSSAQGMVYFRDSTTFKFALATVSTEGTHSAAFLGYGATNLVVTADFTVPITGWEP